MAAALLAGAPARAQESTPPSISPRDEAAAKLHYEKGTAAYALGDFVEAARQYEEAFRLKLDPALLFNAAQAQRRAGNRQRAIELYENLLRVFPTGTGHEKARQHLDALRGSAALERPASRERPGPTPPPAALRAGPPPAPARPALYHQTWFLATVSAVVIAGVVGVAVRAAGDKPARPSWGQVGR